MCSSWLSEVSDLRTPLERGLCLAFFGCACIFFAVDLRGERRRPCPMLPGGVNSSSILSLDCGMIESGADIGRSLPTAEHVGLFTGLVGEPLQKRHSSALVSNQILNACGYMYSFGAEFDSRK